MHTVDTLLALLANLQAASHAPLSVTDDEAFAAFDAASDACWDVAPAWFTDALKANNYDLANPLVIDPCDWSPDAMCELQIMLAIGSLPE